MDGGDGISVDSQTLNRLSEADKAELAQLIGLEQSRERVRQYTNELVSMCWKQCVKGTVRSNALDSREGPCLSNCVARFFETNDSIVRHLSTPRQGRS